MLLRRLRAEGKLDQGAGPILLVLGQLCILIALMLGRLAEGGSGVQVIFGLSLGDFWQGFMAGLAGVFMGVSIPLNLSAIRRRRNDRR